MANNNNNKNVIHRLRSVREEKTVPSVLSTQDLGHSFPYMDLLAGE